MLFKYFCFHCEIQFLHTYIFLDIFQTWSQYNQYNSRASLVLMIFLNILHSIHDTFRKFPTLFCAYLSQISSNCCAYIFLHIKILFKNWTNNNRDKDDNYVAVICEIVSLYCLSCLQTKWKAARLRCEKEGEAREENAHFAHRLTLITMNGSADQTCCLSFRCENTQSVQREKRRRKRA